MNPEIAKGHWENVYATKQPHEVSWTQENPTTSLDFIHSFQLPATASIIDVGGGDSKLVDHLVEEGFEDITVLDISEHALARARKRLGEKGDKVHWVVADITTYQSPKRFDVWHDRATFHFFTSLDQIEKYVEKARNGITKNGFLTIGTFSTNGPKKCSGLEIHQYSENTLEETLDKGFKKIRCITEDHETPFHTTQNFLFCSFRRT